MGEMEEGNEDQSLLTTIRTKHIEDILSRVGASSPICLLRCRISCKSFNVISQAEIMLKCVNCEDLFHYFRQDSNAANKFSDSCIANCNSTALFVKAYLLCGSGDNLKKGIQHLENASKEGHDITTYLLGLLSACCQGPDRERIKGMNHIRNLKASIGTKIVSYRLQLQKLSKGFSTMIPSTICRSILTQITKNINANSSSTTGTLFCISTMNALDPTLITTFAKHASGSWKPDSLNLYIVKVCI